MFWILLLSISVDVDSSENYRNYCTQRWLTMSYSCFFSYKIFKYFCRENKHYLNLTFAVIFTVYKKRRKITVKLRYFSFFNQILWTYISFGLISLFIAFQIYFPSLIENYNIWRRCPLSSVLHLVLLKGDTNFLKLISEFMYLFVYLLT